MLNIPDYSVRETAYTDPSAGTQVAKQDPTRVYLGFFGTGAQTAVTITPGGITGGMTVYASYPLELYWNLHAALVSQNWYMAGTYASTITVYEVFYRPNQSPVSRSAQWGGGAVRRLRDLLRRCAGRAISQG